MRLVVIRHAIAEERTRFAKTGRPDADRPLTDEGRRKMARAARGLALWLDRLDLLATSPLVRAGETAAIVRAEYPHAPLETWPELSPDARPEALLRRLRDARGGVVAVVSHNPLLPRLLPWLLTGETRPRIDVRKGSVHVLDWEGKPEAGEALLVAALPPGVLRRMSRGRA